MAESKHTPGPWSIRRGLGGSNYHHLTSDALDNIAAFTRPEDAEYVAALVNAAPALLKALESASHLLMATALVITHAESRHHAIATAKDAQAVLAAIALATKES